MMCSCRVCLIEIKKTDKDIRQLPEDLKEIKTYSDIIMFCLNIEVLQSDITTALCENCYSKIIEYYKFKLLALKNDEYLKSIQNDCVKSKIFLAENIKCEDDSFDNDLFIDEPQIEIDLKKEVDVKVEKDLDEMESDDELLSVIKKIKYEFIKEESKENAPIQKKKLKKSISKNTEIPVCEICGKAVKNIKTHMNVHENGNRKKFECKLCDKTFATIRGRKRHHRIKHLGIKAHCDICNKDVTNLRAHTMLRHETESLPFPCPSCERRYLSKSHLLQHMLTHTKDRPNKCDVCDKGFRDKGTMQLHKRQVHDKEKSHLCQVCSKRFFKKYHLQVHLRSHTKEKPYKCDECGKHFSSCSILKNHKEIHTDVKSHACEMCDMRFTKANYLRAHMVSHTKERKYPCQYCGVKFGRSDHRARHQRTAHERHLLAANV